MEAARIDIRCYPQAPEAAPFFLPTVAGFNPKFISPDAALPADAPSATSTVRDGPAAAGSGTKAAADSPEAHSDSEWDAAWESDDDTAAQEASEPALGNWSGSRVLQSTAMNLPRSRLGQLLSASATRSGKEAVAKLLSELPPSQVDVQIRGLCTGVEDTEGVQLLKHACDFFAWQLATRQRFELCQAHMNLLLKVHAEVLASAAHRATFAKRLETLRDLQKTAWTTLQGLLQHTGCLVQYLGELQ